MLKRLRLGRQIGFAQGLVMAVFIIVAITTVADLAGLQTGFSQYRASSSVSSEAGLLRAEMLATHMAVKDFLIHGRDDDYSLYQQQMANMEQTLNSMDERLTATKQTGELEKIRSLQHDYDAAFNAAVNNSHEREAVIQNALLPAGQRMREAISTIVEYAYLDGETKPTFYASRVQEAMFLGRLYFNIFLKSNRADDYEFAMTQLQNELSYRIDTLQGSVSDEDTQELIGEFRQAYNDYLSTAEQVYELTVEGHAIVSQQLDSSGPQITSILTELSERLSTQQASLGESIQQQDSSTMLRIIVFSVLAVVIGVVFSVLVTRGIVRPVNRAVEAANVVASGDLNVSLDHSGSNETSRLLAALQKPADNLRGVMTSLSSTATTLTAESETLNDVTGANLRGADELMQKADQISTAINQMASSIRTVAGNAQDASGAADEARVEAEQGRLLVDNTIHSVSRLETDLSETAANITQVAERTQDIGSILDSIRAIAEQTNLLALNAAIESARAGEQGRGFAVVADEVRNLAGRSQEATEEIQSMIEALRDSSDQAVARMAVSRETVTACVSEADKSGSALTNISAAVNKITDMNSRIAAATEEQSVAAEHVSSHVAEMHQISQLSRENVDRTVNSSQQLAVMAGNLDDLIGHFKI